VGGQLNNAEKLERKDIYRGGWGGGGEKWGSTSLKKENKCLYVNLQRGNISKGFILEAMELI